MLLKKSLLACVIALIYSGCSDDAPPLSTIEVQAVQGTISNADGSPLSQGVIEFHPVENAKANGMGMIKEGQFTLKFLLDGQTLEGIPAGTYEVRITMLDSPAAQQGNPETIALPDRVTIEKNDTEELQLKLPK